MIFDFFVYLLRCYNGNRTIREQHSVVFGHLPHGRAEREFGEESSLLLVFSYLCPLDPSFSIHYTLSFVPPSFFPPLFQFFCIFIVGFFVYFLSQR